MSKVYICYFLSPFVNINSSCRPLQMFSVCLRACVSSPCAPCLCSCRTEWCSWGLMFQTQSAVLQWAARCSGWLVFPVSAAQPWLRRTSDSSASPTQCAGLSAVRHQKDNIISLSLQGPVSLLCGSWAIHTWHGEAQMQVCELSTQILLWLYQISVERRWKKKSAAMLTWLCENVILIRHQ